MKSLYTPIILLISLLQFTIVQAQNWTGDQNSDWNNSANWSAWPLDGEDIIIDPALYTGAQASPEITANSLFSPAGMAIQNGGTLTIAADLSTDDDVEVLGPGSGIVVNGGNFSVNLADGGRLIFELGSYLVVEGGEVNVGERFTAGEDVVVTINGGEATSGERWIMDGGGMCIQNGGTVTVGQVFAIGDGSPNNSSGYELHGGTLDITGEMAFENELGEFEPTFLMTDGELVVNGDVVWFGEAPGAGTPRFIMSGGTAVVHGAITNGILSTVSMFLSLSEDAEFNHLGNEILQSTVNDTILISDNVEFVLQSTGSMTIHGVLLATGGIVYFSFITTVYGEGEIQFHNLFVQPFGSWVHHSPEIIRISGDLNAQGPYTPITTSALEFNGSTEQLIDGINALTFHELVISNSSAEGVTMLVPGEVEGHLQLNDGLLNTSNESTLTILDNATSNMGGTGTFVNGPMTKVGDDAYVFPIGKNDRWSRLSISAPSIPNTAFTAQYFNNAYDSTEPVNDPLNSVSDNEYWSLETNNPADEANVSLFWEDPAFSDIDCGNVTMARWNDSSWDQIPSNSTGDCFGDNSGNVATQSLISEFGILTLGYFAPVGLVDEELILFQTYPNPTTGELTIALNHPVPGLTIDVLDLTGKRVLNQSFNGAQQQIDLSNQPPGVYLLQLVSENSISSHKVVKR